MTTLFRILISCLPLLPAAALPALAMDFRMEAISGRAERIVGAYGSIKPGDSLRLRKLLEREGGAVVGLALSSPGGAVIEAARLARLVLERRFTTMVEEGQECHSACFLVFAAGARKLAAGDARIGVHSVSVEGVETVEARALTLQMARAAAELDAGEGIITRMVLTPPGAISILTHADLRAMGVTIPGDAAAAPLTAAAEAISAAPSPGHPQGHRGRGRSDRMAWEAWLRSLPEEARKGALWWSGMQGTMAEVEDSCRAPGHSAEFAGGCVRAQRRLQSYARLMEAHYEYVEGWNALP